MERVSLCTVSHDWLIFEFLLEIISSKVFKLNGPFLEKTCKGKKISIFLVYVSFLIFLYVQDFCQKN